ncbi:AAA family ATPase [Candidatus Magnetobacterium casense]|uniref:AAA family ATPase n=1 Tax=Candidatus Magnetobacterium casense TaxID=1455061 RepID=A0ABS6S0Y6_9BACT|nr:AAA family ATPase [Candidatus Magnetobacterium casensis]MBV6342508.1 AAA family ATPase [Candidatus Magnetobacterium casensis]
MLEKFFVKNYKNILMDENESLSLGKLNIFIGPNGCGKSNLFEAIKFLPDCIEYGLQKTIRTYRKGVQSLLNKNFSIPSKINFKWQFPPIPNIVSGIPAEYELDLSIDDYNYFSVEREIMQESKSRKIGEQRNWMYLAFNFGKGVVNRYEGSRPMGFEHPEEEISSDEIALKTLSSPKQYPAIEHIKQQVSLWRFYNANHISIRNIKDKPSKVDPLDLYLDETGENLAIVLHNLTQRDHSEFDFEAEFNSLLKSLLDGFDGLKFPIIDSQHIEMRLKYKAIKKQLALHELSDGTIRMLCWAAVLCHPTPSPVICIDEPEVGLHPEWINILADLIKVAVKRGKTQVLLATHSPDILDCFSDRAEDVIVMETDDENNAMFTRLDPEELEPWLERYRLGEMYRNRESVIGGWSY